LKKKINKDFIYLYVT